MIPKGFAIYQGSAIWAWKSSLVTRKSGNTITKISQEAGSFHVVGLQSSIIAIIMNFFVPLPLALLKHFDIDSRYASHMAQSRSTATNETNLLLSRGDNCWLLLVVDLSATAASGLESLDNVQRRLVSNLAEDDVLAIEPAGDNCGDKELGTVAVDRLLE